MGEQWEAQALALAEMPVEPVLETEGNTESSFTAGPLTAPWISSLMSRRQMEF